MSTELIANENVLDGGKREAEGREAGAFDSQQKSSPSLLPPLPSVRVEFSALNGILRGRARPVRPLPALICLFVCV